MHNCVDFVVRDEQIKTAAYLEDIHYGKNWLHIWFPTTQGEISTIRSQFPEARSFADIVKLFSSTLGSELRWMVPAALLLSCLFLFSCFPNVVNFDF